MRLQYTCKYVKLIHIPIYLLLLLLFFTAVTVPGPAGNYAFITDLTIIDSLLRVNELFSFGLTTDIAMTTEQTIIETLVTASVAASVEVITESSVTITIMAVDEWVTVDG